MLIKLEMLGNNHCLICNFVFHHTLQAKVLEGQVKRESMVFRANLSYINDVILWMLMQNYLQFMHCDDT